VCGVCVGGGGRVFNYTYIYSQKGRPCEVAELVGVLVAETIHPACMCEGGGQYSVFRTRGGGTTYTVSRYLIWTCNFFFSMLLF
jgi:hypothetical protein